MVWTMRRMLSAVGANEGIEILLNRLAKTQSNAEFLSAADQEPRRLTVRRGRPGSGRRGLPAARNVRGTVRRDVVSPWTAGVGREERPQLDTATRTVRDPPAPARPPSAPDRPTPGDRIAERIGRRPARHRTAAPTTGALGPERFDAPDPERLAAARQRAAAALRSHRRRPPGSRPRRDRRRRLTRRRRVGEPSPLVARLGHDRAVAVAVAGDPARRLGGQRLGRRPGTAATGGTDRRRQRRRGSPSAAAAARPQRRPIDGRRLGPEPAAPAIGRPVRRRARRPDSAGDSRQRATRTADADRRSQGPFLEDGTLLKPVAVDTTVADGSGLRADLHGQVRRHAHRDRRQVRRLDDDGLVGERPQVQGRPPHRPGR